MRKLVNAVKHLYDRFTSFEGTIFTYSLSYSLLLSIAPILAIIVLIFKSSAAGIQDITRFVQMYIPKELIDPFIDFLLNNNDRELIPLLIFLGISFWISSKSIYSFLLISSKDDNVDLPGWFLRILSILDFIILLLIASGIVFLFQKFLFYAIYTQILLLFIGFCFFYRLLAFRYYHFKDVYLGALFTSVGLSLLGALFFFVIENFTTYSSVYGPLSSLVILFLSAYIVSSIIYIGYCINQMIPKPNVNSPVKHYVTALKMLEKFFPFNLF